MSMTMVPVWFDEYDGYLLCAACANDVAMGGTRVKQGRVPAGRYECEYCHERVGETA